MDDIIPIALRLAHQRGQYPSVTPEAKARYENFKGSPHWLADYLTKMQLSEHIPHPVSMKTFRRMQDAHAKSKASQVPSSCLFVCDPCIWLRQ